MFQLLSLVMDLVPFHAEDLRQHPLNEVMPVQQAICDFPAGGGKRQLSFLAYIDQTVAFQPLDRHGDGWGRNVQPACQAGRNHNLAFTLSFRDGLEIVLLGGGDSQTKIVSRMTCYPFGIKLLRSNPC